MYFNTLLLSLPLLVLADGNVHLNRAPQAPAATGAAAAAESIPVLQAPPGTGTIPPLTTVAFTLASTNPTAIPVASITSGMAPQPTVALLTTPAAGAIPSSIPNAPPLPDLTNFDASNYPPFDKPPPIDSPEVQGWIAQVQNSGVEVPDIQPFAVGGCPANENRIGNLTECWWTCGHCTRTTDITSCPKPDTWGSSYDDGPSDYTNNLLDYLNTNNLKTTFFIVGSRAAERPTTLQAEYMLGHQLSVHTWSHTPLTTQTTEEVIAEFGWTMKVIRDVTGVTPNTMRPPYGDIDDRIRAICLAMGLTPIIWTVQNGQPFDTQDWQVPAGEVSASTAISNFENILQLAPSMSTGFIVLEHDLFQQTVDLTIGYFLPAALAQTPKLVIQPIRECLGLTAADSYIETNDNSTHPPIVSPGGGSSGQAGGAVASPDARSLFAAMLALGLGLASLL